MQEYIVLVQDGPTEDDRRWLHYDADDLDHAEEQALDESSRNKVIAIYERRR